jgi:hypothetical protein
MPCVGFEPRIPASERGKTVHALARSATVTGQLYLTLQIYGTILGYKPTGRKSLGGEGCRWKKDCGGPECEDRGREAASSGCGRVAGSCGYSNDLSDTIKGGEYLE